MSEASQKISASSPAEALLKLTETIDAILDKRHAETLAMFKSRGYSQADIDREMVRQAAELHVWREGVLEAARTMMVQT